MQAQTLIADRYELLDFVAEGGMGRVYQGRDIQTDLPVAIKVLKLDDMTTDGKSVERFVREGEALRVLNHPNIVKLLATANYDENYYLVMEFVAGGSLSELLRQPIPLDHVLAIALELADALSRAHHLKIIHRDIKPGNILIADDGTPRLTDFGVARVVGSKITNVDTLIGTVAYLPPEAFSGTALDERADLWSFGVVLFQMLTGQLPFGDGDFFDIMANLINQPVPDLEALRPDVPVALVDLIYRMLEKDRNQRIPSARRVGTELEAIIKSLEVFPDDADNQASRSLFAGPFGADQTKHNLPVQVTPFVGREHELEALSSLLANPDVRLITIQGLGGMGKTRLSLEVAAAQLDKFASGVYFVPLAALNSADSILTAIGQAIDFQFYAADDPKVQLINFLREKVMLLVMDNFEHLTDGAGLLAEILQAALEVKIIVTSRVKLNLQEETVFRLEGMEFEDWQSPEAALEASVVKLFLQSAQRAQPGFVLKQDQLASLTQICRQLEGMPLGIILAATWVNVLSIDEIATEIAHSIDFLEAEQHNVPTRQRSIRSVFDYSWSLLSSDERDVLAKLAIFRGGFTRDGVQTVTGISLRGLAGLVNKSMLRRDPTGRYEIHELLRQYCEDKLASMPHVEIGLRDFHQEYYMGLLIHHGPDLSTFRQLDTAALLKADLENISMAWEQFVANAQPDQIDLPAYYLTQCCEILGIPLQGQAMFQRTHDMLVSDPGKRDSYIIGTIKAHLGLWYSRLNDSRAYDISVQALQLLDEYPPSAALTCALFVIGSLDADWSQRESYLQRAMQIAKELQLDWLRGMMFYPLTWALHRLGKLSEVLRLSGEVTLMVRENTDYYLQSSLVAFLGYLSMLQGQYEVARGHYERTLELGKTLHHPARIAWGYDGLSWVASSYSDHANHKKHLLTALKYFQEIGQLDHVAREYGNVVHPVVRLGEYEEALRYAREGIAIARQIHNLEYTVKALVGYADVLNHIGQSERAVELLTLAANHPALLADVAPFVDLYLSEATLAPDVFEAAQAKGNRLDFETTLAEILARE